MFICLNFFWGGVVCSAFSCCMEHASLKWSLLKFLSKTNVFSEFSNCLWEMYF